MHHKEITSTKNELVKYIELLRDKSKVRKQDGVFILEGTKELELAIKGNYEFKTVLYCEECINLHTLQVIQNYTQCEIIKVNKLVYDKIAVRESTGGVVIIAKQKLHTLDTINWQKNNLILVCEGIEKPGNLGAIMRTADAANVDAVICCNMLTDIYNPLTIRNSLGTVFTNTICVTDSTTCIEMLKLNNVAIFSSSLQASLPYTTQNYKNSSAIVVGTEATGLSAEWELSTTQNIIIPMLGAIDSMNVSVAAAIIIFEAVRQRQLSL